MLAESGFAGAAAVFDRFGFEFSNQVLEVEGAEYGACSFMLDGRSVRFRVGKTTPTKVGQFVTVWVCSDAGPIRPFDIADGVELFIVAVSDGHGGGQFVFPTEELCLRGIVSAGGAGGKRAFRVYPPWLQGLNTQAARTQVWQSAFFLENHPEQGVDGVRARALYR